MRKKGVALVTLLVFTAVATSIISAVSILVVVSQQNTYLFTYSHEVKKKAQSGAETGAIRILRNPNYTGESLTINGVSVNVVVTTSGNTKTITSTASNNDFTSIYQIVGNYAGNQYTITSKGEI